MTQIVKIGGKSGATLEKNQRIIEQIRHFDEPTVVVVSANGGATDRIQGFLEGKTIGPEQIFQEFEMMYKSLETRHTRNGHLTHLRDLTYDEFERAPKDTAALHMSGERLAAALFDAMLDENGVSSEFVDFVDEGFPVKVSGDDHNARIDYDASREAASAFMKKNGSRFIVLPGYGGLDVKSRKFKTLGRGGSDTSAMGNMYAFSASGLWMLTDVPGILRYAGLKDRAGEDDVVGCLGMDEIEDAASLGVKLPGRKAVEGIEKYFGEGASPQIYITRDADISGPRTAIVRKDGKKEPVKLVGGRNIIFYKIKGDIRGLHNVLMKKYVEHTAQMSNAWTRLMVPEYDGDSRSYVDGVLSRLLGARPGTKVECYTDLAWVGVVGNGMESNGSVYRQEAMGIAARAASALSSIDIVYQMDPGEVSLGYVVHRKDSRAAQEALYNEFLNGR